MYLFIPVEAMESNPTKAKKHLAAPAITPANPYGKKPPLPYPSGTCSGGILQLSPLAVVFKELMSFSGSKEQVDQNLPLIEPPMMTKMTTVMLTKVKTLVKTADERTPNPKRTAIRNVKFE